MLGVSDFIPEITVLALAVLWDVLLGEPKRLHPVVWMGQLISFLERWTPRQGKTMPFLYGLGMALCIPGIFALATALLIQSLLSVHMFAYILGGAYILKSSFAVRELDRAAFRVYYSLETRCFGEARQNLRSLVSRDTTALTPELIISATVESVAENTTDSFVAPWLVFALFGLPGALAYRALNTLDSMIGYHYKRYEYLGKAAARFDDLLNWIPARLTALCLILAAHLSGLNAQQAWQTMCHEHRRTESPNAGWTMSAMAGALGIELHKVGHYRLGTPFHPLSPNDIMEAVKVMRLVAVVTFFIAAGILLLRYRLSHA